ncbi:MAG: tRNA preQ1(34) S-adenosylmethionine ribosyltransferase-isomerase QueA [Syntrophobacteraceae bacterium]|jgi:S-adenosylmethionine:tRNA ribosyltransferase-isomerase
MADDAQVSFRLEDYDYDLPPELIAQRPAPIRDESRLLVFDRSSGAMRHSRFDGIGQYLRPGDLLVVNDTRVVPARLMGRKETGGVVELLVLDPYKPPELGAHEGYCCLAKSSKGIREGQSILFSEDVCAEVIAVPASGRAQIRFCIDSGIQDIFDRIGRVPLPPYIKRPSGDGAAHDRICYQTEYAKHPGAVAAPTAGLHFTKTLLNGLASAGIEVAALTLHVGYGTFEPLRCQDIRVHKMHSEFVEISEGTAEAVNRAKRENRRVIAVGTTVVRTLEWVHENKGEIAPLSAMCDHYIFPGRRFAVVDCMVTNFHLPKSSLILLVSAFAGRSEILSAYREAIRERYRFFSYGDAMLIL